MDAVDDCDWAVFQLPVPLEMDAAIVGNAEDSEFQLPMVMDDAAAVESRCDCVGDAGGVGGGPGGAGIR